MLSPLFIQRAKKNSRRTNGERQDQTTELKAKLAERCFLERPTLRPVGITAARLVLAKPIVEYLLWIMLRH
jgi:hypothetical protein